MSRGIRALLGLAGTAALFSMPFLIGSCGIGPRAIAIEQLEQLESLEGYLPITPDSVAERYRRYDPATFHARFHQMLEDAVVLVDSLNAGLDPAARVDTLSIDHTFENFGVAALRGRKIYLSSSYFYVDENPQVIRSILFHEFGHLYHRKLTAGERKILDSLWYALRSSALFFVLRDGEYSGNSWLGGHPEESSEELFASAFNLLHNREQEIDSRLLFHAASARQCVRELKALIRSSEDRDWKRQKKLPGVVPGSP